MIDSDAKRLSRLTALLVQLQTGKVLTAPTLAERFSVSVRTIYRDIRALEQAGIPIVTEEGRGYSLMEGYRVPPVMFTEAQANALVLAEQLVLQNKDASFVRDYTEAIDKVKAVLSYTLQGKANLLSQRTAYSQNQQRERSSSNLSDLQRAITSFTAVRITYQDAGGQATQRIIEPFAMVSAADNWLLIAHCRMRRDFRFFRLDRIQNMDILTEQFTPHTMTLQQYFEKYHTS